LTQFRTLVVRLAVDSYDLHYALEATCKQFKLVEWFDPRCQSGSRFKPTAHDWHLVAAKSVRCARIRQSKLAEYTLKQQLPITPAVSDFIRSDSAMANSPRKLILVSLAVTSIVPAIFTVIVLLQGQQFHPEWAIVWILFWVVGGIFDFVVLSDAARERRDLAGGVFTRWVGPFAVRPFRNAVQVVVDGRKLQTIAAPLEPTESGNGIVDYLSASGALLELRDGAGQVLWTRFPGS
jgi:hypothetical protein